MCCEVDRSWHVYLYILQSSVCIAVSGAAAPNTLLAVMGARYVTRHTVFTKEMRFVAAELSRSLFV